MNNIKYTIKLIFITVIALVFSAFKLPAKLVADTFVLRETPMKFKADAFYAVSVTDERADRKLFAQLVPGPTAAANIAVPVGLKGGGLNAIERYLKQNLPYQNNFKPVLIKVKKLTISEYVLPDGRVDGKIELSLAFDVKTGEDLSAHLTNYNGGVHYIRNINEIDVAEPALRNALESAMVYLNNWLIKQNDINPLLAREVKLKFSDYKEDGAEDDTVYYAANRPLTWADFKDKTITNSRFAAQVMPGLGFTEQTSIKKGVIYVEVAMKVYVPKSACWVSSGNLNDYNLNHEQRHFDIVKLVSERFKRKLLTQELPVLNYDGSINVEYFEALREIDRLQKQYDGETSHGINIYAQERWNNLIDKNLKAGTGLSSGI